MKKITLLLILILISSQNSFAGLNSSQSEMKYKKQKALGWNNSNIQANNNSSPKEKQFLKNRALRCCEKHKTVFANEMNNSKKRSLRWYETNNQ